jgi:hypothetical protein
MNAKPVKPRPASSKATGKGPVAKGKVERGRSVDADITRDIPRPGREGPDNLRQRADWFRRRSGGAGK